MWRNIERLADVVFEHNVDIIHARSRAPAWSAYYAAKETEQHFVTTFHNAYAAQNLFKRLYNSVMAKGEVVIAISNFVADYAKKYYRVPPAKLRIIPRGVDITRFDRKKIEPARIAALREAWKVAEGKPVVLLP